MSLKTGEEAEVRTWEGEEDGVKGGKKGGEGRGGKRGGVLECGRRRVKKPAYEEEHTKKYG